MTINEKVAALLGDAGISSVMCDKLADEVIDLLIEEGWSNIHPFDLP